MRPTVTLSSRIAYENRWMKVREDSVEFPGGTQGIYGVVEKIDFSLVVPFDNDRFYLVEQFRYAPAIVSLEFPQGSKEDDAEADPENVARSELIEETGLRARHMRFLGNVHVAPGYSNQRAHIYLASDLIQGQQHLEPTELGLRVHEVSVCDAFLWWMMVG